MGCLRIAWLSFVVTASCAGVGKPAAPLSGGWVFPEPFACDATYRCSSRGASDATISGRVRFDRAADGRCRTEGATVDEVAGLLRLDDGSERVMRTGPTDEPAAMTCAIER